jgi:hypothetical protein
MTSDRRLPIPFKDGLDGNYIGSFVVSREYQEEKAQVELLINHHSFTKVDLPR